MYWKIISKICTVLITVIILSSYYKYKDFGICIKIFVIYLIINILLDFIIEKYKQDK